VQAAQLLDVQAVVKNDSVGVCGIISNCIVSSFYFYPCKQYVRLTYPHNIFAVFGPSI
jgi:hypothetical protein